MKSNKKSNGSKAKKATKSRVAAKKTTKVISSKNTKRSVFGRLFGSRRVKLITAGVVLVIAAAVGFIGYSSIQKSVVNAVTPLGKESCVIRGRGYNVPNSYCTKVCISKAGSLVKDTYDYCRNSVSTSISKSDCGKLGRKWLAYNGCARRWQQKTISNALQCSNTRETYHVYRIDYCGNRKSAAGKVNLKPSGGGKGGWTWPVPGHKINGARWGQNISKGKHKGIDIGGRVGTKIVAAHGGKVTKSGSAGSCGQYMVIKATGTPYHYAYQHIQSKTVGVGKSVSAGQKIGEIGSVVCGSYKHLHFSVEKGNYYSYASESLSRSINPCNVLPGC